MNSASTPSYSGTIIADNDVDFYVFYAAKGTRLSTSTTDDENPLCSEDSYSGDCGNVSVELYNAAGEDQGGPDAYSSPSNGVTVPVTWTTIIGSAGTYYLEVNGSEGSDANDNPTAVQYTLSLSGTSPAVVWPAPAPTPSPMPTPTPGPVKSRPSPQPVAVAVDSPGTTHGALDAAVRPRGISFTPTAGGPVFGGKGRAGIHWTSWSVKSARGSTVISLVASRQSLGAAYRRCYKATVTLTDPRRIDGHEVFTRMSLSRLRPLRRHAPKVARHYHLASHGYWGTGYGWAS